jgi:hypothetical protein
MPGYIKAELHEYQHPAPMCPEHAPHQWNPPICGAKTQYVEDTQDTPALSPKEVTVGSRTRDRSKGEPGLVEKDLRSSGSGDLQPEKKKVHASFNQSRGKTKKSSLLHLTSTE